jgi:hypothetical protein
MGKSDKIDEELVCIDALVQRLKEINPHQEVVVCRELNDPPDFWITIGGAKYAAEVTSIVTDEDYAAQCRKLIESVQTELEAESTVEGTYALVVMRCPEIPPRGTTRWHRLVSRTIEAIQSSSGSQSGTKVRLLDDGNGHLALAKCSDDGRAIGLVRTPVAKWEGEVRNELSLLLQHAIDTKRTKIEKKGIPDRCPDVLLIFYDAYNYGDIEDARFALATVQGYEWFHTIFWAASFSDRRNILYPEAPGRGGAFLYSKNSTWR